MPSKESSQDTKQAISCLQTLLAIIAVIVGAIAIGFLVTSLDFQHAENGLWILFGIGLVFFMLVSVVIKRKQKKSQDLTSKQIDIPKNDFILPNTALGHPQSDKVEKNYCESSNKLQALPSVEGHEITEKEKMEEGIPVKSFSSPAVYTIYPQRVECTCPDWKESRSAEPLDNPCRICKHLANYYSKHFASLPEPLSPFLRLIVIRGAKQRGLPYGGGMTSPYFGREGAALIEFATGIPWVSIHKDSLRYSFNIEENRWSYGEKPSEASKIVAFIYQHLGMIPPSEQAAPQYSKHTEFFDKNHSIPSVEPVTWEKNVFPMLEDALGEQTPEKLEWVERKGYFVIYHEKISNWICRVYYGSGYLKYVMFKDKTTLHMKAGDRLYKRDCPKLKEVFLQVYDGKREA